VQDGQAGASGENHWPHRLHSEPRLEAFCQHQSPINKGPSPPHGTPIPPVSAVAETYMGLHSLPSFPALQRRRFRIRGLS